MVAFLPQVFFHLLTGSSTTSPGITLTKCKVPRGTTWDQKDGIQHGNKNDRFFHELMKWMQRKPNKNPSSHWPLSNISLGAFFVSGPWQGAEFTWLMTSVDVNCFEVHHAAWCEHQRVFWPQFFWVPYTIITIQKHHIFSSFSDDFFVSHYFFSILFLFIIHKIIWNWVCKAAPDVWSSAVPTSKVLCSCGR